MEDIAMTADANKGAVETGPLVIAEVSLSKAARGGTEPEVIRQKRGTLKAKDEKIKSIVDCLD